MITKDLVIIGGGSAGMAAAISAFDNGIKDILILERGEFLGGILNQCIHDGFGLQEYKEALTGPEFLTRLVDQINERKIEYKLNTYVTNISKDRIVQYVNSTEGLVSIEAKAIIVSTGCYERGAGAISLPGDRPAGIVSAGQAQLYLNQKGYMCGKNVFILGSGDIGLIMARRLTLEGAHVLGVAEIMPYSNGLNRNIVQCLNDFNIPLYLSHTVTNVIGKTRLEKIVISQVDECFKPIQGTEKVFEVDTLLLSVGLIPYTSLLSYAGVPMAPTKGALVDEHYQTKFEGIFTCGNSLHVHDLVDMVVEESRETGKNAANYILRKLDDKKCLIECKPGNLVGYVVPNFIDCLDENICLKFRVRKPLFNIAINLKVNNKIIKSIKKSAVIPSEMQKITLDKSLLNTTDSELILEVEQL